MVRPVKQCRTDIFPLSVEPPRRSRCACCRCRGKLGLCCCPNVTSCFLGVRHLAGTVWGGSVNVGKASHTRSSRVYCAPTKSSATISLIFARPKARAEHNVSLEDMTCPWFSFLAQGREPPSWEITRRLYGEGQAGILVPSFAPDAAADDHNLVLWRWSDRPPHRVQVFDPSGRLPKDQLSWS